jgi:hypothetical protein
MSRRNVRTCVTVGALKSRRSKNRRRIGDCRDSRLEVVNSVGVEFVAYCRARRDCEGQAYDEQPTTRVHTTMLVELVASRQIWITKRVAAILPANLWEVRFMIERDEDS